MSRTDQGEYATRTCFISFAYPPSTTPAAQLTPMLISDLRLETHHTGRVLVLRAFGHPQRMTGVQNAVEDENGNVDRIGLYNFDTSLTPERILGRGAVIAVKEPYYKVTVDGGYTIRVDHPSDVVRLSPGDSLVPEAFAARFVEVKDAATLKAEGNAAYGKKDCMSALDRYTEALAVCSDQVLRYDLHRNRANANLLLARYEPALADALAAIIPGLDAADESAGKLNAKAYFRAGRAAYCLRLFEHAKEHFRNAELSSSGDADAARELTRTTQRLAEEKTGCYDFTAMNKAMAKISKRLDYADFLANTEVKTAGKRGRGLFAAVDLKAGDLVLVEKAFSVVFDGEKERELYVVVNVNTDRISMGSHAHLFFDTFQKLAHNPEQAKAYLDLYDKGYTPKTPPQTVDGATVIDTFRATAIAEVNCYGARSAPTSKVRTKRGPSESVGVWLRASHMNHACDANAFRAFIGDIMVVHACRDIKAGDEILISYINPEMDGRLTQDSTKKTWGFVCDCAICVADSKTPETSRARRLALWTDAKSFLSDNSQSGPLSPPSQATITKAETLRASLDATYDTAAFAGVPRLTLPELGVWLCHAHNLRKAHAKSLDCAKRALGDLEYGISTRKGKLIVDHSRCYANSAAVDAALLAANACAFLGQKKLGKGFAMFATRLWNTMYADLSGLRELAI